MTNSWAMLFDYKYGEDRPTTDDAIGITEFPEDTFNFVAAQPVMLGGAAGEDTLCFDFINPGGEKVVITDDPKDNTFWKYDEGKILREIEQYLTSTYNGHYVGDESKVQTLDLIDSIGDAEAFCRSNAIKYLSRFGKKGGKNRLDILKVIHYAILLYHFSDLPITSDETPSDTHSPLGY